MNCQSCGMPMAQDQDHGGARQDNPYCKYCTDSLGNLKSKEEVREGMINFQMQSFSKTREEAEKEVDNYMTKMPAWQEQQVQVQSPAVEEPLVFQPQQEEQTNPPLPEATTPAEPSQTVPSGSLPSEPTEESV